MASRTPAYEAAPLDVLLATVPSLPRAILARLTARMIERLDELDGDPDLEDEPDCCPTGDDMVYGGPSPMCRREDDIARPGSDDDDEATYAAAFNSDQSVPLETPRYSQPRRRRRPQLAVTNTSVLKPIGNGWVAGLIGIAPR